MELRARFALLGALMLLAFGSFAHADGVEQYEEIGQHLRAAQQVGPMTDSSFGDQINLYNGSTSFEAVDISIPGNNALPVQLARSYSIENRPWNYGHLGGFGDWNLDVPYVDAVVTADNGWVLRSSTPYSRCSDNVDLLNTVVSQTTPASAPLTLIYDGAKLHIPGAGDQELLVNSQSKSPAYAGRGTYKWVTLNNWRISCTGSTANGYPGEGFVAHSPSGVSYTFNWAVVNPVIAINIGPLTPNTTGTYVSRERVLLLATKVQDRFGNTVTYNYDGSNHLTSIVASDNSGSPRTITLTWNGNTIASASDGLHTWSYSYLPPDANGVTSLQQVTRPDGSTWAYTNVSGSLATQPSGDCGPFCPGDGQKPPIIHCQSTDGFTPYAKLGNFVYSVTAPSGATATYTFRFDRHYRYGVPMSCNDGNINHRYPYDLSYYDEFSVISKQISGPGLPVDAQGNTLLKWTYNTGGRYADVSGQAGGYFDAGVPFDAYTEVYVPGGGACSNTAPTGYNVSVVGPTSVTYYDYGGDYGCDQGRLYGSQVRDLSGNILKTTTSNYVADTDVPNEPFPTIAGSTQLGNDTHPSGNRIRPVSFTQITQDQATFTTSTNSNCNGFPLCFDSFARSTSDTSASSLGYSKTDTTNYSDDLNSWVLGLTTSTAVNGITTTQTDYDSLDRPIRSYAFGKLVSTKAWNADGTLASITDGNNHTTTLGNWYRGLPQSVGYADGSGTSATVNSVGWITAVMDENGYTTSYGYDAMGRVSSITYPAGDDVAWNATKMTFVPVNSPEYGIPAGHWKQTVCTGTSSGCAGNDYTVTYFDAFWRPLVTEHYDAGNVSATLSQSVTRYDAGGRSIFASYPVNHLSDYSSTALTGTHTTYDALNRVTEVDVDSDPNIPVSTTTTYLSGFKTQTKDPDGNITTTSYQAYGSPDTSHPVSIALPEGVTTTISRDVFGKPLSITRGGTYAGGSVAVTRSFVYDANQQLCKRIDPESGTTAFGYDLAGNLQWSAAGLNLPSTTSCDTSTAYGSGRRVDRGYDARNRVTSMTYPDGYSNSWYTYAPDGALLSERVDNAGQPVTTTYSYDKRRLLTGETLSLPGTSPFSLGYSYDANAHLASETYPDGRIVGYAPNALGQATQVGAYASAVSYFPNGAIKQFTYGNGIVHTMQQDARQLPDRSTDSYGGSAVLDDGYDYDPDSNVAAITDYLPGSVGNRTMTYDGLDRLIEADSSMFGGDGKALYSYDPIDNLRSARVGNFENVLYGYDGNNLLTGLNDPNTGSPIAGYSYDLQGNVNNNNGQIYQFDLANRLRSVNGVESYLYDAAGHRVQKTQTGSGSTIDAVYSKANMLMYRGDPTSSTAIDYIYLGGSLVAQVTNNASQVTGNIDGVTSGTSSVITGWACSTGMDQSINVELYAGGPAGEGGTRIGIYPANQPSEAAVASSCQTSGSNYRYSIALDTATRAQYAGQSIYIYGDSPVGNNNNQLANSGQYTVPPNPTPPDAPASISVPSSSTTGAAAVSWTASANASSYVLQQSANGGAWTQVYSGASTSFTISGLGNGSYVYQVEACNTVGCSAFVSSGTLTVLLPPPAPASLSVPASSSTSSVTASWASSATATSYLLQQSLNGGAWTQAYSGTATSAALSLSDGSYKYQMQGCNASGCGGFTGSGTLNVAIAPASISPPASATTPTFTVSWSAVANATSYVLQQSFNGGAWSQVYSGGATSTTVTASASGNYQYRVSACGSGGCSGYTTSNTVPVTLPPVASHLSGPASSTTGTFTMSWTAESGSTRYQLNQKLNSGSWAAVYNSTGLSWTSSGLASGTYYYVVYACNGGVCAPASNQVTVVVSPIPIAPGPVHAPTYVQGSSFVVSWTAVSGATSYNLRQTNTTTGAVATKYSGSATSATITAMAGYDYQYAAQACNANGCSGWANAPNVTDVEPAGGPQAIPASGSSL